MYKVVLLALFAVVAVSATVEHDAAIAAVAEEMPEHAAAFAELSAAAGTADVFSVLDSISANIKAEKKHAKAFYQSYKKTTDRDLRKYKLLVGKLSANERRAKGQTAAEIHEIKQTRRAVNANVRTLSRAVGRFQHIQAEEKRTTHKKKSAMRHLNNKIADRKVYLRVLKSIRQALSSTDKPVAAKFLEALSVANANGLSTTNSGSAATVFLAETEAIEQTTDNSDEVEADAEVDSSAFDAVDVSDEEMEEVVEAEDSEEESNEESEEEEAADEEAESVLEAAEEATEEESEEAESEEDSEEESEVESEADSEEEESEESDASEARMMQVLEKLAAGSQDDNSVADLLALIDSLVADVRESIAGAKKRKVAVLAKYTKQMKNLQELANSIKATIRRLQVTVQTGRARLAELEQTTHAVDANTKETDAQLKSYREMYKGLKKNWTTYETRYKKNQAKRTKQLEQLEELKRRLAAVERTKGSLNVDLSKVNLRYRWKASPFGACGAACGPSTRTRKVQCVSFSGEAVKHTFCDGQKKPKKAVKCQKKQCPSACVMSAWKPRGKCSNQCGTGVRLHTRSVVEPARFGGACPQQFKLTKHKVCKVLKGCKPGEEPTDKSAASAAAAAAKKADLASSKPADAKPISEAKKAKIRRCLACKKGKSKEARTCRIRECLSKKQRARCTKCGAKKSEKAKKCRAVHCHAAAKRARDAFAAARKARKARKAAKADAAAAAAGPFAPLTEAQKKAARRAKNIRCIKCKDGKDGRKCRYHNCLNKPQKVVCKACGKSDSKKDKKCRISKCRKPALARQAKIRAAIAAKRRAAEAAADAAADREEGVTSVEQTKRFKRAVKRCRAKCAAAGKTKCKCVKRVRKAFAERERQALRDAEAARQERRRVRAERAAAAKKAREAAAAAAAAAAAPAPSTPAAEAHTDMSPEVVIPKAH